MIKKMVKFSVVLLLRVKLISAEMEVEGRESPSNNNFINKNIKILKSGTPQTPSELWTTYQYSQPSI